MNVTTLSIINDRQKHNTKNLEQDPTTTAPLNPTMLIVPAKKRLPIIYRHHESANMNEKSCTLLQGGLHLDDIGRQDGRKILGNLLKTNHFLSVTLRYKAGPAQEARLALSHAVAFRRFCFDWSRGDYLLVALMCLPP